MPHPPHPPLHPSHYYEALLEEAGRVLPVAAATFGMQADWLPTLTAHPEVTHAMQVGAAGRQAGRLGLGRAGA